MFEMYTEKARRIIFFARYEASQYGSMYIETEHLLMGLLREDKALSGRILPGRDSVESIRRWIDARATQGEKVATSVDLPLSAECKRALTHAAEESERLRHRHIGPEHLLLGILHEEDSAAATVLREHGVTMEKVRQVIPRAGGDFPSQKWDHNALEALIHASRCAVAEGKELVSCFHLLAGLLEQSSDLFGLLADPGSFREKLGVAGVVADEAQSVRNLPLDEECRLAAAFADVEAKSGNRVVEPPHLLMGILHVANFSAAELLRAHGVTLERARQLSD